jgi:hypothetical protein
MKKSIVIFSIFHFAFCISAFAQTDTEFWFAAPELIAGSTSRVSHLIFGFAAYDQPATVTISQPANPSFTPVTLTIAASGYVEKDFIGERDTYVETKGTNTVRDFGFRIVSDVPVTAYYQVKGDDSEIYTLKGRNALGTHFIVPMEYTLTRKDSNSRNSIQIVASEDNTTVTVTVSQPCEGGITVGQTVTNALNCGQTLQYRSNSGAVGSQLRGTVVTSDKPVAVNSTDDMVLTGTAADLIGEQLVPVDLAGSAYIATSSGSGQELVCLFPIESGDTKIFVNGSATPLVTLNPSGIKEYTYAIPASGGVQFTSDGNNFIAFQVTGTGAANTELGGTMLPNLLCTGSREIAYKALFGAPRVTLLVRDEDKDNFTLSIPVPIPGTSFTSIGGGWSTYVGQLPALGGTIRVKNSSGLFHFGVLDAEGGTCSYGYFSNYSSMPLESATGRAYYRVDETITLSLNDADDYTNIVWKNAGGETVGTGAEIQIPNCTLADAGKYVVQGESKIGCTVEPDTFYVHVFAQAKAENLDICYGNSLTLNAAGAAPFQWSNGSTADSITVNPTEITDYWVRSYYLGADGVAAFLLTDTFHVAVRDSLKPEILGNNFLINGSATLTVSKDYETYLWNTGETAKTISVNQASDYWVKVTDGDCQGSGIFTVQPAPEINISLLKTEFEVCLGETNFEIAYQIIAGEVGKVEISINGATVACNVSATDKKIIVTLDHLAPDVYAAELTVYDAIYGTSQRFPLNIMVKYSSGIITQRWNDILGVMNAQYNGGYSFTAFQWYKNGAPMAGETHSYIYSENEFSTADTYSVLLTNSAGKQIFTCGFQPEHLAVSSVQTFVKPLQTIKLNANGTASFYDLTGTVHSVQKIIDNQIVAPDRRGIYFLEFDGKTIKIVVQ